MADKYKVLTIYTMTKYKLNTKQIDPFCVKYQTFDEYLKNCKVNIINLGQEKPTKRQNFFEISEETNGQATSRQGNNSRTFIEREMPANPLQTIGEYDDDPRVCHCQNESKFFGMKKECTCKSEANQLLIPQK